VIFSGGAFSQMPGGMMSIVNITEAANFESPLNYGGGLDLNRYFAHYQPLPSSSIIEQEIGAYPFANQTTAANAVITKPLAISLMMICPVREPGGYFAKLSVITSLQQTFAQHNISGGTYHILTPAFYWFDCVMLAMRDVSTGDSGQAQFLFQLDFLKPLVTLQQASIAQNSLMSKISNGTQINNLAWSGIQPSLGNTGSGVTPPLIPSAQPSPGTGPGLAQGGIGADLSAGTFAPVQPPL
jgi:hypothetical protein